ncbi:angiopoietin-4-like [Drosophila bipectinata]|uniref:angiopoietin-4-like n=1 Tax=Drosophila bipectinata TaxID=42026 RepID=UPI0038B3CB96
MILSVAFISTCFLISASLGSEESCYLSEDQEDECASVCYPIVKPLLRYFEKINEKDAQLLKCKTNYTELQKEGLEKYAQLSKCQLDYSDLVKSHLEVLSQLKSSEVKYEKLLSKQQEVDNLINQKNKEIELLKYQNRNLKKTSELATLTNQFHEDIDKLGRIVKIGEINSQTTSKTQTIDFPDSCPRSQKKNKVLREIRLPETNPFKVACVSHSEFGSGWLSVYIKHYNSQAFNRTYEDYERGFGDVGTGSFDEFFIGLNRLHHLTSGKPHEMLLITYQGPSRCDHFVVGDRSEGCKVKSIGNFTGGEVWMSPKQGSKFSTFDQDEVGVPGRSLAREGGFGWWFDPNMSPKMYARYGFFMYIRRTD